MREEAKESHQSLSPCLNFDIYYERTGKAQGALSREGWNWTKITLKKEGCGKRVDTGIQDGWPLQLSMCEMAPCRGRASCKLES